jgi:hypothetical protein
VVVNKASGEQKVAQLHSWDGPPESNSWKLDASAGLVMEGSYRSEGPLTLLICTRAEMSGTRELLSNCNVKN